MAGTAIFDLDRTLTRLPTWSRFIWRINRGRPAFWLKLPWLVFSALSYKAGAIDRTNIKNRFLSTLDWACRETIEAEGRAFARDEIQSGLRRGVSALVAKHRSAGDKIYLATAAMDFIASPIAELLGFDGVICTRTEWPAERGEAPVVSGKNCYGAEKFRQVSEMLNSGVVTRPVAFYSDHVSDLDLMRLADVGIAVNPSGKLRREARRLGLPIIDLNLATG